MKIYNLIYSQNYVCELCKTSKFHSIEMEIEEVAYDNTIDDNGNHHDHDDNYGVVFLICENKHSTTQEYIPSCECGWTKLNPEKSCETFVNKIDTFKLSKTFDF